MSHPEPPPPPSDQPRWLLAAGSTGQKLHLPSGMPMPEGWWVDGVSRCGLALSVRRTNDHDREFPDHKPTKCGSCVAWSWRQVPRG